MQKRKNMLSECILFLGIAVLTIPIVNILVSFSVGKLTGRKVVICCIFVVVTLLVIAAVRRIKAPSWLEE